MNLYRVIPSPPESFDLGEQSQKEELARHYASGAEASVRAMMVTSASGDTVSSAGSSEALSRGADRLLLGILRESADVVVVGASTIRQERVPLPRTVPLVVLTHSGDLHGHQLVSRGAPHERLIIASPPSTTGLLSDALGPTPWEHLEWDPRLSVELLHQSITDHTGARHVLIEGGRRTWEYFAPLTTELLVSTPAPPRNDHHGIPPWWPGSVSHSELRSLFTDDTQMLYYRYDLLSAARPRR